jgi:hypothetical protein
MTPNLITVYIPTLFITTTDKHSHVEKYRVHISVNTPDIAVEDSQVFFHVFTCQTYIPSYCLRLTIITTRLIPYQQQS